MPAAFRKSEWLCLCEAWPTYKLFLAFVVASGQNGSLKKENAYTRKRIQHETIDFLMISVSPEIRRISLIMAENYQFSTLLLFMVVLLSMEDCSHSSYQEGQTHTLLTIRRLLNYPPILSSWNSSTDLCNTEMNAVVVVVCYGGSITQLHVIGKEGNSMLPRNFSMDSLVTTLVMLPGLKVLTLVSLGLWGPLPPNITRLSSLEILNMTSNFLYGAIPPTLSGLTTLQALALDANMFSGHLPDWIGSLTSLRVLSLRKNVFNSSLPDSLTHLQNLRVLLLSHNHFYGQVPDLSGSKNLQVLDLEDNALGPQFPRLGTKLVSLVLSKNRFRSALPIMSSQYQLQRLDLSFNKFVGPFPPSLLSLPSITSLNVSENQLTGMLLQNTSCSPQLVLVDLSSNLLTGHLPDCLIMSESGDKKTVRFAHNCLMNGNQDQNPPQSCQNGALAVRIIPKPSKEKRASKSFLAFGVAGGVLGGLALVATFVVLLGRRLSNVDTLKRKPPTRLIAEKASTDDCSSKLFTDARYISQTTKLMGALGLPAYRTFTLEELEEATNNFDSSTFIGGEGSQGQMYRGKLKDGSMVAIRCLKMKKRRSLQHFVQHIELISKLRHPHLVSALGHCFECYFDDSTVSRIFLIFEYVRNGSLRTWVSDGNNRRSLCWAQRISVSVGLAKGIQFLHTGIVPAIYSNNLNITDVLLDHNLVAKISSYNLPLLAKKVASGTKDPSSSARNEVEDKVDIYDFGVILLEMLFGKPLKYKNEVVVLNNLLKAVVADDDAGRRSAVDPAVQKACSNQSLKTMMEVCVRCLQKEPGDRPSIEDVLWNLQFAAQVEDAWRESASSEGSPISPSGFRIAYI